MENKEILRELLSIVEWHSKQIVRMAELIERLIPKLREMEMKISILETKTYKSKEDDDDWKAEPVPA